MNNAFLAELAQHIGSEQLLVNASDRQAYRYDHWCIKHYRDWMGQSIEAAGCVVKPRSAADVQVIVKTAAAHGVAIVPFGLGSGVCGGIEPQSSQLLLDMGQMNTLLALDEENLLATFEAGMNGLEAEQAVAAHGLTIGHWPQSIGISSVGGWVSTRASGQFSTAYGNIEDMIYSLQVVLPNGELVTLGKAPRAASGPDLRHLLMGAEGTLGVITQVTLSLRRVAPCRRYSAYYAADMAQGFNAQRQIVQADWKPPVMRQYDASEVARLFPDFDQQGQAMLLMVHEGPQTRVSAELDAVAEIASELGLIEADSRVGELWMECRNHVPQWRDLLEQGWIADTIEISAPWNKIVQVYQDAIGALNTVPSIVNASAHSSHVYRSGINLYFTFACQPADKAQMEALYFTCWDKVLEATAAAGGGIAHHHGSGRLRKNYLHHDLGSGGIELLRTIKRAIDPNTMMNPGNLLPD